MLKEKKPSWVYQGKSIRQVVEELATFENLDLPVLISIDYGDHQFPIGAIKNKDAYCLIFCQKAKDSIEFNGLNKITINHLIKELKSRGSQDLEVRLSLDLDGNHKPISRIGKKNGSCLIMSCSDYYDQQQAFSG